MSGSVYYPPVKFKFQVLFLGPGMTGEASFMEVSGIHQELGEETINEGGVLDRVHRVPLGLTSGGDLTLKRGILTSSVVRIWIEAAMTTFTFVPIQVIVSLLDENNSPALNWMFNNCWPKKYEVDSFNSTDNNVAVESLVLAYSSILPTQ